MLEVAVIHSIMVVYPHSNCNSKLLAVGGKSVITGRAIKLLLRYCRVCGTVYLAVVTSTIGRCWRSSTSMSRPGSVCIYQCCKPLLISIFLGSPRGQCCILARFDVIWGPWTLAYERIGYALQGIPHRLSTYQIYRLIDWLIGCYVNLPSSVRREKR